MPLIDVSEMGVSLYNYYNWYGHGGDVSFYVVYWSLFRWSCQFCVRHYYVTSFCSSGSEQRIGEQQMMSHLCKICPNYSSRDLQTLTVAELVSSPTSIEPKGSLLTLKGLFSLWQKMQKVLLSARIRTPVAQLERQFQNQRYVFVVWEQKMFNHTGTVLYTPCRNSLLY